MKSLDVDAIGHLVRTVGKSEVLSRYQALADGDVIAKPSADDPDDVVTAADRAAEARLLEGLSELAPGVLVVGEEGAAKDPALIERGYAARRVLYVDPLDGTKNFAEGSPGFGVMVALVENTEPVASWIYLPLKDELFVAERGSGVRLNGARLQAPQVPRYPSGWSGTLHVKFLPEADRSKIPNWYAAVHRYVPSAGSAAIEYRSVVLGEKDFTTFYRLLPWDHAPGAVLLRETGGEIRFVDGSSYAVDGTDGLVLAVGREDVWERIAADVFGVREISA